jgi:cellobiose-specific phosphotransferase system component IIC
LLTLVQEIVSLAPACEASWQFEERLKKLKEATQEMLKAEWERVKLGEKNYVRTLRDARFSAMGLFIVLTIWLFVSLVVFPLAAWLPEQFKG